MKRVSSNKPSNKNGEIQPQKPSRKIGKPLQVTIGSCCNGNLAANNWLPWSVWVPTVGLSRRTEPCSSGVWSLRVSPPRSELGASRDARGGASRRAVVATLVGSESRRPLLRSRSRSSSLTPDGVAAACGFRVGPPVVRRLGWRTVGKGKRNRRPGGHPAKVVVRREREAARRSGAAGWLRGRCQSDRS
jgi:hypothetical protein